MGDKGLIAAPGGREGLAMITKKTIVGGRKPSRSYAGEAAAVFIALLLSIFSVQTATGTCTSCCTKNSLTPLNRPH